MEIFQAIVLGIIEGLTEFLPVSSTGHLIVAEHAIGFKDTAELFTVVIQVGAIAAVVWFYRQDIIKRIAALLRKDADAVRFWLNLAIAIAPASLMGLLLDKTVQGWSRPVVVAWMLILGGIILWLVDSRHKDRKNSPRRAHHHDEPMLDDITPRQAFGIGMAQVTALVPGVSRSGASIVGGLLSGLDRVTATAFSFYLSIPIIILASGYKLIKEHDAIALLPGGSAALVAGTITAFATALMAVSWLLGYVSKHDFKVFAYYRIAFGIFILLLLSLRLIR